MEQCKYQYFPAINPSHKPGTLVVSCLDMCSYTDLSIAAVVSSQETAGAMASEAAASSSREVSAR